MEIAHPDIHFFQRDIHGAGQVSGSKFAGRAHIDPLGATAFVTVGQIHNIDRIHVESVPLLEKSGEDRKRIQDWRIFDGGLEFKAGEAGYSA